MSAKNGSLTKRELQALDRAWAILSDFSEAIEEIAEDAEINGLESSLVDQYHAAMNGCVGLCELLAHYDYDL